MTGKIPSNYEETKDWLPAYNVGEQEILPNRPCIVFFGLLGVRSGREYADTVGLATIGDRSMLPAVVVPVISLAEYESARDLVTPLPASTTGLRPIVVNSPAILPPNGYGRVSRDWPLYAFVDGEEDFLSLIAQRPVYPSSTGFRAPKNGISEIRFYWRQELSYAILSYPPGDAKSGLCLIMETQAFDETPLRLLSFQVPEFELAAGGGFFRLPLAPEFAYPQAVASIVSNRLGLYSIGTYDLHLSLQVEGKLAVTSGIVVPLASLTVATEGYPQDDLVAIEEVSAARSYGANITRIYKSDGDYDCSDITLDFAAPKELFGWDATFRVSYDNERIGGLRDRTLFATMDLFASFLQIGSGFQHATVSGWGNLELRSERKITGLGL